MRTMLLPGLLATARRNVAVREERVHIFEVGQGLPAECRAVARGADPRGILILEPGRATRG